MARKLQIEIVGDARSFERAMGRAQRSAGGFGGSMGRLAKTAGVALGALAVGSAVTGKKLADMAGDAAEVESKFRVVFGRQMPKMVKELDKFAKVTGASRYELREQVADLGALLKPMVGSRKETARMSIAISKLSTDLSSFNNVPVEDTLIAIRAGLVGEAEPLRRFGVLLNEAKVQAEAMRITGKKSADQLTDAEKVQARYNLILAQTKLAQGDATRTAGSYSNQMRRLKNNVRDMATDLGRTLLPAFQGIVRFLNEKVMPRFQGFMGLFGKERTFKGKVRIVLQGLGQLARDFWDAIFGPQFEKRLVEVRPGRMKWINVQADSLAKQFGQAIAEELAAVDWGKQGKNAARRFWDAFSDLTGKVDEGLDEKRNRDFGSLWEDITDSWAREIRGEGFKLIDLFEAENAEAARAVARDWQAAMGRVANTARIALGHVRLSLDSTSRTALRGKDRIEDLRSAISSLRGKSVTITAKVKYQLPSGFRSDAHDRAGDISSADLARNTPRPTLSLPSGARQDVDSRLWHELGLARLMGLQVTSTYRPGARVRGSGRPSDHGFYPSKAIDVAGSTGAMYSYAQAVAGMPGVDTVIYSPIGLWSGGGWGPIRSAITKADHYSHVHVDTFDRGGWLAPHSATLALNKTSRWEPVGAGTHMGSGVRDVHFHGPVYGSPAEIARMVKSELSRMETRGASI